MKHKPLNMKHTLEKVEMKSLVIVLDELLKAGFKTQFKATEQGLQSLTTQKIFKVNDITVVHFYRFEGESDPSDSSIVYAIEANDGEKGTLVDGYGTASDSQVSDFMVKIEGLHK